ASDGQPLRIAKPNGEMARGAGLDVEFNQFAEVVRRIHRHGPAVVKAVHLMIANRDQDCIVGQPRHATSRLYADKEATSVLQRNAWFGDPHVTPGTGRPDHSIVDFERNSTNHEFKAAPGEPIESRI